MTAIDSVRAFNEAVNRQDVEMLADLLDPAAVFESTDPPDGTRFEGREAIAGFWRQFFAQNPEALFVVEEEFEAGDRVVARWVYRWSDHGHVRGVDLFRVAGGRVVEKLSYVKG